MEKYKSPERGRGIRHGAHEYIALQRNLDPDVGIGLGLSFCLDNA